MSKIKIEVGGQIDGREIVGVKAEEKITTVHFSDGNFTVFNNLELEVDEDIIETETEEVEPEEVEPEEVEPEEVETEPETETEEIEIDETETEVEGVVIEEGQVDLTLEVNGTSAPTPEENITSSTI